MDLASQLALLPEDRVTLLAPLLLLLAIRHEWDSPPAAGRRDGLLAILVGGALEIVGIAGESWSIARLGLPVAALGLARWRGAPRPVVMALALFAIPPPHSVISLTSPALESALARAAAALLAGAGLPVQAVGPVLGTAHDSIHLAPHQGGATLAVAIAGMGWYAAVRAGAGFGTAALQASLAALLALPLQLGALLVTGALVGLGRPELGEFWLRNLAWIVVSGLGLFWVHRPAAACAERPA